MAALPIFRYHPDPVRTGSVEPWSGTCDVCGEARGFRYGGPVYCEGDAPDLCPWCIADGSAAEELDAEFVDAEGLGDGIPAPVIEELTSRTPGYAAWQSEVWPACCSDATVFRGPTGIAELRRDHRGWEGLLVEHVVHGMGLSGGAAIRLVETLDRRGGPTAYVFECRSCLQLHFHIDAP